jgi:GMP synthase-like glutamine amidotransferase
MKPLLFAKADPADTFGIGPTAVADAGAQVQVWDAINDEPAPSLDDVSGVVLFGSSYNIEHANEQPFIDRLREMTLDALDHGTPFLGICFGAQVLAWSLGAEIRKAPVREIGYVPLRPLPAASDDQLLSHYADGDPVFQWHMDTFDLPGTEGVEHLAAGDQVPVQAFRIGDRTWATQFHLEIDRAEIDLWSEDIGPALETDWHTTSASLRTAATVYQPRHEHQGAEVFRRFVKVARSNV